MTRVGRLLAAAIAFRLAVVPWVQMAGGHGIGFRPVGVAQLFGAMPSAPTLVAVQAIGLAAAVASASGRLRPTPAHLGFVVGWLALLVLGGLRSSGGKLLHNEVLLLLAAVPFLLPGGWRGRVGDDPPPWAARSALVATSAVYWLTGWQKLTTSGPRWALSDNLSWVLHQGAAAGPFPALAHAVARVPVVPQAFGVATLVLEVGAPALLVWRPSRRATAVGLLGMHAAIGLLLGLDYSAWAAVLVAVALVGEPAPARLQTRRCRPEGRHRTGSQRRSALTRGRLSRGAR